VNDEPRRPSGRRDPFVGDEFHVVDLWHPARRITNLTVSSHCRSTARHIDTPRTGVVLLGSMAGAIMADTMGTLRIDIEIENPARPGERRALRSVLVDSDAELSWIPGEVLESLGIERFGRWQFRQADGTVLERWTGPAFVHALGKRTTDDVVFGAPGSQFVLGCDGRVVGRSYTVAAGERIRQSTAVLKI
jgi:hypothetical protein